MSSSVGGTVVWNLDVNSKNFDAKLASAKSKVDGLATSTKTKGQQIGAAFTAIGKSSIAATAAITGLVAVFRPFIRDAVTRIDILNNFPKVMSNMGISADEAAKASDRIVAGIKGLPTALDTATLAVQRLTTKTKDVDESTDIFLALNNAVLAGAAPMQLQAMATEQFAQAFAKGKPDMMEWRSMMAAMPAQLDQVAKSMKLTSADELGAKLRDGTVTMEEFSNTLVKLNSKGVGGLPTLAEQAKNATGGIGTAMANARIAVVRGIVSIMKAIGTPNITKAITSIGEKLEGFFNLIAKNADVAAFFIGTILVVAFTAMGIALIKATWPILLVAAAVTGLYLAYKRFKPQVDAVIGAIRSVVAVFMVFWNTIKPIREFIVNQFKAAWNDLRAAFESIKQSITPFIPLLKVLAVVLGVILLAPVLVMIATIAVLTAVFVAITTVVSRVIGWFSRLAAIYLSVVSRIYTATTSKLGAVINLFKELPGRILRALGSLGSLLYNSGKDLINGLKKGITDAIGGAIDAVKNVAGKVGGAFKSVLGIKSPSKVFEGYGQDITAGLVKGIAAGQGIVESTVNGLSSDTQVGVQTKTTSSESESGIVNHIGTINISSEVDGKRWLERLTRDSEVISKGLVLGV